MANEMTDPMQVLRLSQGLYFCIYTSDYVTTAPKLWCMKQPYIAFKRLSLNQEQEIILQSRYCFDRHDYSASLRPAELQDTTIQRKNTQHSNLATKQRQEEAKMQRLGLRSDELMR
jgi:hypothetical protein